MSERPTTIELITSLRAELKQVEDALAVARHNAAEWERMYRERSEQLAGWQTVASERRAVLEEVEWEGVCCGDKACPVCDGLWLHNEHFPSCPLGRALNRPECGETTNGT